MANSAAKWVGPCPKGVEKPLGSRKVTRNRVVRLYNFLIRRFELDLGAGRIHKEQPQACEEWQFRRSRGDSSWSSSKVAASCRKLQLPHFIGWKAILQPNDAEHKEIRTKFHPSTVAIASVLVGGCPQVEGWHSNEKQTIHAIYANFILQSANTTIIYQLFYESWPSLTNFV